MRDHLKEYWGFYAFSVAALAIFWARVSDVREDNRHKAYCYDRGSVLVDTDAGPRCAPLYSLEKVR